MKKGGVHIKVKDFERSLDFYLKLGFIPVFVYGNEALQTRFKDIPHAFEKYSGIVFEIGTMLFEIANGHIAVKAEVFSEQISSSKISLMFDTDSLAKIRNICEENNFEIAKAEVEYYWGTRELVVRDPDGVIIVFREPINGSK